MNEYEKRANEFLKKYSITINVEFLAHRNHFADEKAARDVYKVTLNRPNRKEFSLEFGQSINKSGESYAAYGRNTIGREIIPQYILKKLDYDEDKIIAKLKTMYPFKIYNYYHLQLPPTNYDILACLTKYSPGTFEDFCSDYGCDTDSIKAKKTYDLVVEEWFKIVGFFSESELEELQEIN